MEKLPQRILFCVIFRKDNLSSVMRVFLNYKRYNLEGRL